MAYPTYTKTFHNTTYPTISPTRSELSTTGKVILITGGGAGIGPRIAHAFATSGATKIAILGRTKSTLLSTKKEIEAQHPGVSVLAVIADLVDRVAVNTALSSVKSEFGPIDILVGNAGHLPNADLVASADIDEFMSGFEINVKGNLILSQAFLSNCSPNPTLVHISTGAVHMSAVPVPMSSYASSKLAAAKLLEYLAKENPHVRVMFVHPGVVETSMSKKGAEAGMIFPFDDVELPASFVVWAASPEADFLRGKLVWANWDVDELIAKKHEILSSQQLTIGLVGWA